ncbi:MAG TPA: hypothetical protein VF836_01540 [Gemmatimonadaceae bacterium]
MTLSRVRVLVSFLAVVGCETKRQPEYKVVSLDSATGSGEIELTISCGEAIVRDEGIGKLRIGTPVDSIAASCPVFRDTTMIGAEGMPARKIAVLFFRDTAVRDTVVAEIVNDTVWRVSIVSALFRTVDSLGVGTPLSRLLQLKNPRGMTGEGKFFVASPEHCGMSFRLTNAGPGAERGDLDRA